MRASEEQDYSELSESLATRANGNPWRHRYLSSMGVSTLIASKTIIVADDTEFVRDRFTATLADAGHRVTPVNSGTDLVARVQAGPTAIDLLVVDLRLRRLRGLDLIRALHRLHPTHPPIVVFSGTIADASEVRLLEALSVVGCVNEYTAVHHIVPALEPYLADDGPRARCGPRVVLGIPVTHRNRQQYRHGSDAEPQQRRSGYPHDAAAHPGHEGPIAFQFAGGC